MVFGKLAMERWINVDNEYISKFQTKELTEKDLVGYKLPKFIDVDDDN